MNDLETAIFKSDSNELLLGIEQGSGTLIVQKNSYQGGLVAYDQDGKLKYEITSARGIPTLPSSGGEGFMLTGTLPGSNDQPRLILVRHNPRK